MTSTPSPRQPSARALATRSLTAANRLTGTARTEALQQHAARVWPSKSCALTAQTARL